MVHFFRLVVYLRRAPGAGLLLISLLVTLAIVGNAAGLYYFDRELQPDVTFVDAIWTSVISISTIGYGDYYAKSIGARLCTIFFIVIIGLGSFTLLLGIAADRLTDMIQRGKSGMAQIIHSNHIVIVNFPGEARLRQVLRELSSDPANHKREFVIVTDQIQVLPFTLKRVSFVYGSPLCAESFESANIKAANLALVLANDYNSPQSDAVSSSIVSVLKDQNPKLHTVAECLDDRHRLLFETAKCDAIVCGLQLSCNLLTQEVHDPGIAQTMEVITSNLVGPTVFSTKVEASDVCYTTLAKALLDKGANVLSVIRSKDTHTSFKGIQSKQADRLIYVASRRYSWNELHSLSLAATS